MITIAELIGRMYLDLPGVESYVHPTDAHRAIVSKLNVYLAFARQGSDLNILLKTSQPFIPADLLVDVSALYTGTPCWVEMLGPDGGYYPIRSVNLSQIQSYALLGDMACAFWSEESIDGSPAVNYVQFTFVPNTTCRIRYDQDTALMLLANSIQLPDHVADLVIFEAENSFIPKLKLKIAMDMRRNEEARQDVGMIMGTLDEIVARNKEDIPQLRRLWEIWAFRDRGTQNDFTKPTPTGRMLYGEGTNF
jgi:hypothetical protein